MLFDSAYERERFALGEEFRRLRRARKQTGTQVAMPSGMSQSKLSKIESVILLPTVEDVQNICAVLQVPSIQQAELLDRLRLIKTEYASWRLGHSKGFASLQLEVAEKERQSSKLRVFQTAVIPGLLQIPRYARRVMELSNVTGQVDLEAAIGARLARQVILYERERRFEFLITESALLSRFCDPEIVLQQLDGLREFLSLRNVSVGLLPNAAVLPRIPQNSFTIYDNNLVVMETFSGGISVRDERDIQGYHEYYQTMQSAAIYAPKTKAFLDCCKQFIKRSATPSNSSSTKYLHT